MTDLQIANMLADYHKECELAETLREKADVQLKHARLIREALCQPPVSGRVCFSSDCFYHDKTTDTCVGDYANCTVKQTHH